MSAAPDLGALVALTAAQRDRETARLGAVLAEERRLRAALARLDAQAKAARALPGTDLAGLRGIGADMAWQGWVARQRAALHAELALVRARKEQALPRLRAAFGRAEAAAMLAARQAAARQGQERARAALGLEHLALLRHARGGDHMS